MTNARYGILTTTDVAESVQVFATSGVTAEIRRQMLSWPEGPRLFEHLRTRPGILRLTDLSAYFSAHGFSAERWSPGPFQATLMHHQGREVGHFFLTGRLHGQAFSREDEELLQLFSAQTAVVIANARVHSVEQRVRADLEIQIDTSSVGMDVVFEIGKDNPVLRNKEARRLMKGLQLPGSSVEQLLDRVSCRRANGQENVFAENLPAIISGSIETARAESVELSIGEDCKVKIPINATQVQAASGKI